MNRRVQAGRPTKQLSSGSGLGNGGAAPPSRAPETHTLSVPVRDDPLSDGSELCPQSLDGALRPDRGLVEGTEATRGGAVPADRPKGLACDGD